MIFRLVIALCLTVLLALPVNSQERHGISAFGELKYPAGFKNFDYVNPNAPKGGTLSQVGPGGVTKFDSFNSFILKGDAAQGLNLLFDTLMTRAYDEPDAMYGLIAKSAEIASDRRSVIFRLRPEALFADGSKVRAEDVAFSFRTIKKEGHPFFRSQLRDVSKVEVIDPLTVRYVFQGSKLRDLPLNVAGLPVLSKAYFTRNDFTKSSLKPPLGSGPYRIGAFKAGTFVDYERRADYWARDLNVNAGRFNFDKIRYEYFRDRNAGLESFKAGAYDLREEFTSRVWATGYDFPAANDGRVKLVTLPDMSPSGAQGFFINMRRQQFQDPRVRQAIGLVFDFPWTNRNMFYSLYKRTESYFENSDLKAIGPASASEAEVIRASFGGGNDRSRAVIGAEPYVTAQPDGSGRDRKLLKRAFGLLREAGWQLPQSAIGDPPGLLRNARGGTLNVEFLIDSNGGFVRILNPYVQNLRRLGVNARIRAVDPAQFQRRVKAFDFDITIARFTMRLTPGAELRNYFSSASAKTRGSRNLSGIQNPRIDWLIGQILEANSRAALTNATRALDRLLRAGHYWVPHWYKASHTIAYWDKFDRPRVKPKFYRGIIDTWWYDDAKAARLDGGDSRSLQKQIHQNAE